MNGIEKIGFCGRELVAVKEKETVLVAIKPICDALELEWPRQMRAMQDDPVLSSTIAKLATVGADGKSREMLCLPLEFLNGWLFKISARRYTGARRDAIIRYQRECYRVLAEHFMSQSPYGSDGKRPTSAPAPSPVAALGWDAEAVEAVKGVIEEKVRVEAASLRYGLRLWCERLGVTTLDELLAIAQDAFEIKTHETLRPAQIPLLWGFPPFHAATRRRVLGRLAAPRS